MATDYSLRILPNFLTRASGPEGKGKAGIEAGNNTPPSVEAEEPDDGAPPLRPSRVWPPLAVLCPLSQPFGNVLWLADEPSLLPVEFPKHVMLPAQL
jgi:hypothetical protein